MEAKVARKKKTSVHRVRRRLSLRDRLGHLTYRAACRMLGKQGEQMIRQASQYEIRIPEDIRITGDSLIAQVFDGEIPTGVARVTIVEMTGKPDGLHNQCSACGNGCIHVAAVLSTVLESKVVFGLSTVPDPKEPLENLTEQELVLRAIAERSERATKERMQVKGLDPSQLWSDYVVTSLESGKSYRVALRGKEQGESFCSCPDYRVNSLGTCKHILHVLRKVEKKFPKAEFTKPHKQQHISLGVRYHGELGLRFYLPAKLKPEIHEILERHRDQTITSVEKAVKLLKKLESLEVPIQIFPDADEFIDRRLMQIRLTKKCAEIRKDPKRHPFRKTLLKGELLPYQMDGIAFAAGAGRAILADDMGLGKTIQGIGTAELLARYAEIRNVLVVCPASLKSQWKAEIHRFSDRSAQIVMGSASERVSQYEGDTFFKICNYEQVLRDEAKVQQIAWDLIILDEGQRIKNWESKTSRVFKTLKSTFALVLSGTPLENRLEELYTVASFVDSQRLGPAYRFFHQHRTIDQDSGRTSGYKNLDVLRKRLEPILLRRTRASVMMELPERTTEIVRIRPTDEQQIMSGEHVAKAAQIAAKSYLTEMDFLRIQKHLLMARMAANSTQLVDKKAPGFSSKLDTIDELFEQLADEPTRKIILFSEWSNMLNLIEPLAKKHKISFVRLEGKIPQKQRQGIVHQFQNDPKCRMIMMTNAGSTGLNLQAANTIINVELPWNPAVLEQRIARAHRMGQKNPVHVFMLVTEDTIEERLLGTLAAKSDLALAALDINSDVSEIKMESGMSQLKDKLERLIGKKPNAAIDESMQREIASNSSQIDQRRQKIATASGELLGAALQLVSQLVDNGSSPAPETVSQIQSNLVECVERDEQGRPQLRLTLPDDSALQGLAQALAKLLVVK